MLRVIANFEVLFSLEEEEKEQPSRWQASACNICSKMSAGASRTVRRREMPNVFALIFTFLTLYLLADFHFKSCEMELGILKGSGVASLKLNLV